GNRRKGRKTTKYRGRDWRHITARAFHHEWFIVLGSPQQVRTEGIPSHLLPPTGILAHAGI
ncbi:MAG TPA: hypothetical protein VLH17_02030, partial [Candidatus Binatia bacterium]|nr:hypothetical protein [Candidatus Binatia bacterium]